MSRILALVLTLASCFDPHGGRPTDDTTSSTSAAASTSTVVVPDPSTTSGQVPTSSTSAADTTTSGSTSGDTTSQPLDMPGEMCPIWPGFAWGQCGEAGMCEAGHGCWLAPTGWLCLPECREDAECADACSPSGDTRCDAGVCRPMCTITMDCAFGYMCDGGTCVMSSPCGPSLNIDYGPCDAMGVCITGTCVSEVGVGSICLPTCSYCQYNEQAMACNVPLGEATCGVEPNVNCRLECAIDKDCAPGMRCATTEGVCVWP